MGHSDRPQKFLKSFTSLGFHGRFLRSAKFLLKNRAILRNARGLGNAESTQRLRRYANQRNDAEFVRLESEVRSSIRLSYRHCGILDFRFEIFDLKAVNRQSTIANLKLMWGGRRDSNPQQPEPQSGALPLSYDHHNVSETESKIPIFLCKQRARLFPSAPLNVSAGGPETSPQAVRCNAAASC